MLSLKFGASEKKCTLPNQWLPRRDALLDAVHCSLEEGPGVLHAQRGKDPKAVPKQIHQSSVEPWKKSCTSW